MFYLEELVKWWSNWLTVLHISSRSRDNKYSNKTPVTSVVYNKFPYWKIAYIFNITEWNYLKLCMWIHTNKRNNTVRQVLGLSWQTIRTQASWFPKYNSVYFLSGGNYFQAGTAWTGYVKYISANLHKENEIENSWHRRENKRLWFGNHVG